MTTLSTDYATAQAAAINDQSKSPNLGDYGGDVKHIDVKITVPATFAVDDVVRLARLPAGARIIPALCSVDHGDPGDALTLKLGDELDDDRYGSGIALGNAAGRKTPVDASTKGAAFLTPHKLSSPSWIQYVITTATSGAEHVQNWRIAYTLG